MSSRETINFRVERDFGDVINITFSFLRQNFVLLCKSLLFIVGPIALLSGLQGLNFFEEVYGSESLSDSSDPATVFFESLTELMQTSDVIFMLLNMLMSVLALTVVHGFIRLYENRGHHGLEVQDIWEITKEKFWPMFATSLFAIPVYMVTMFIIVFPAMLVSLSASSSSIAFTGLLMVILVFIWIIVIVYLGVILTMMFPIRMNESMGLLEAFARSRFLIRNNFGSSLGILLISGLLMIVLSGLFYIPAIIMTSMSALHGFSEETHSWMKYLFTLATMIGNLGSSLLYGIPMVAIAVQYFNLVERKEKAGLMSRIGEIDQPEGDAP